MKKVLEAIRINQNGQLVIKRKTHLSHFLKPLCRSESKKGGSAKWQLSMHTHKVDCKNCLSKYAEKRSGSENKALIFSMLGIPIAFLLVLLFLSC